MNGPADDVGSVAVIVTTLELGGAEKQSVLLTRAIAEFRPAYLLVRRGTRIAAPQRTLADAAGIRVVPLRGRGLNSLLEGWRVLRAQRTRIAIALLPGDNLWLALLRIPAGLRAAVGSVRGLLLRGWKLALMRALHRWAFERTVFNSQSALEFYAGHGFRRELSVFIPNCVAVPNEADAERRPDRFDVLMVTRFDPAKDLGTALAGFRLFLDQAAAAPRPHLYIVGYGELHDAVRASIREMSLQDDVTMIPPDGPKERLFRECHVYLSTSVSEAMSNTILEAMAHALPCVVTDVGDSSLLVRDGQDGIVVLPRQPAAVAAALGAVRALGADRAALGWSARQRAATEYSCDRFSAQYEALFSMLEAAAPGAG